MFPTAKPSQLLQSCEEAVEAFLTQGFKANPGLKFANALGVKELLIYRLTSLESESASKL